MKFVSAIYWGIHAFVTRYLLSLCFGVAAFACLYVSTRMSQYSSITNAATEDGKELLGQAAILIHVVALGPCSIAATQAFMRGRRRIGLAFAAVVVTGALFSGINILHFLATEKLTSTANRERLIAERTEDRQAQRADETKRLELQAKLAEKTLEWDATTGAPKGKGISRAERNDIRKQNTDKATKLMAELGKAPQREAHKEDGTLLIAPDKGSELVSAITLGALTAVGANNLHLALLMILLLVLEPILWSSARFYWGGFGSVVLAPATLAPRQAYPTTYSGQLQLPAPTAGTPLDTPSPENSQIVATPTPRIIEEAEAAALNFVEWCRATGRVGTGHRFWGEPAMDDGYNQYCESLNRQPIRVNDFKAALGALDRNRKTDPVLKGRGLAPATGKKTIFYEIKPPQAAKTTGSINPTQARAQAQDLAIAPDQRATAPEPTTTANAAPATPAGPPAGTKPSSLAAALGGGLATVLPFSPSGRPAGSWLAYEVTMARNDKAMLRRESVKSARRFNMPRREARASRVAMARAA